MRNLVLLAGLSTSLALLLACGSCSTPNKDGAIRDKSASPGDHAHVLESSVDIHYSLGHDHYRFMATEKGDQAKAISYLDKEALHEGPIDHNRYSLFFKKAQEFVKATPKAQTNSSAACRNPFTVTVVAEENTQIVRGCRSHDDGSLSRLVREGEFLLYSKN